MITFNQRFNSMININVSVLVLLLTVKPLGLLSEEPECKYNTDCKLYERCRSELPTPHCEQTTGCPAGQEINSTACDDKTMDPEEYRQCLFDSGREHKACVNCQKGLTYNNVTSPLSVKPCRTCTDCKIYGREYLWPCIPKQDAKCKDQCIDRSKCRHNQDGKKEEFCRSCVPDDLDDCCIEMRNRATENPPGGKGPPEDGIDDKTQHNSIGTGKMIGIVVGSIIIFLAGIAGIVFHRRITTKKFRGSKDADGDNIHSREHMLRQTKRSENTGVHPGQNMLGQSQHARDEGDGLQDEHYTIVDVTDNVTSDNPNIEPGVKWWQRFFRIGR